MGEEASVPLLPRVAKLVIYNLLVWPQFQLTESWSHCLPITPQVLAVGRKYLGPKAASLTHPCGLFQVGLFRKSGVKSRIHALRQMNENFPENVSYEDQSAYDVADMVKQFFRDLPEPLFTNKLSETFLHIYQCKWYSAQPVLKCIHSPKKKKVHRLNFSHTGNTCVYAKLPQLYLTLCNPLDCSPPGTSVYRILQTKIQELVAMPFSRESPTQVSNPRLLWPLNCR